MRVCACVAQTGLVVFERAFDRNNEESDVKLRTFNLMYWLTRFVLSVADFDFELILISRKFKSRCSGISRLSTGGMFRHC